MPYHQLRMKYIISQNIIIFIKNWYCKSGIIPIPAIFCIFIMFLILFNFVPIYISFSLKTDIIYDNDPIPIHIFYNTYVSFHWSSPYLLKSPSFRDTFIPVLFLDRSRDIG